MRGVDHLLDGAALLLEPVDHRPDTPTEDEEDPETVQQRFELELDSGPLLDLSGPQRQW